MGLVEAVVNIIAKNGAKIALGAGAVAAGAAGGAVIVKKADDKRIQAEKRYAFEHGVRKGVVIGAKASQELYINSVLANTALVYYVAKCDGSISMKERKKINEVVSSITDNPEIPEGVKHQVATISKDKNINFDNIIFYFDKLNLDTVVSLMNNAYAVADASNGRTPAELLVIGEIEQYIRTRSSFKQNDGKLDIGKYGLSDLGKAKEEYYLGLVPESRIASAVGEYSFKMKMLDFTFSERTKLNRKEIALLMVATCMQCLRIYVVNNLTEAEKAGHANKKEKALHGIQEKVLAKFDNGIRGKRDEYEAPLHEIIFNRGVPYDTTTFSPNNKNNIFRGANHRFVTLGHDPIIGLAVGTINIMTNTLTSVGDILPIPDTYHVVYDSSGRNPIIAKKASFIAAMDHAVTRSRKDLKPLAASIIKQLIHIKTDMYTPAGIQLPGANLILSNSAVDKLTSFISTGDMVKIGASAGIDVLINKLIELLHGCLLLEAKSPLDDKMNQIKTKKIVLYSNAIATSSSIITAIITENIKNLDWGGIIVLLSRLFSDLNFIYDVKREFIRNGLGETQLS